MSPRKREKNRFKQVPGAFDKGQPLKKTEEHEDESFAASIWRKIFSTELTCDMCGNPFQSQVSPAVLRESILQEIGIPALLDSDCRRRAHIYPEAREGLRNILRKRGRA